jgi:hypothetical protein
MLGASVPGNFGCLCLFDFLLEYHLFLLDCRRTAAIQQRVTAVLLSIPKETYADSFQKIYERCQPYVVKDDDYFEGQ